MKIKKNLILLFAGILTFIILIIFLLIPIITERSWWWLGIPAIVSVAGWIGGGIFLLISAMKDKQPKKEEIPIQELEAMAKNYSINHPDNPDNFIIQKPGNEKIGESGAEKTSVLILRGIGTELKEDRVFIINKENRDDFTLLINPNEKEIQDAVIRISKSQPQPIITEQKTDDFGKPILITKTMSKAELKEKEEDKKAEEDNAF